MFINYVAGLLRKVVVITARQKDLPGYKSSCRMQPHAKGVFNFLVRSSRWSAFVAISRNQDLHQNTATSSMAIVLPCPCLTAVCEPVSYKDVEIVYVDQKIGMIYSARK